jgi:hypothetical protein
LRNPGPAQRIEYRQLGFSRPVRSLSQQWIETLEAKGPDFAAVGGWTETSPVLDLVT